MATFKIKNPQAKEWNGKQFVEAWLGQEGLEDVKVSFWNGEITEPDSTFRSTIDGELGTNQKGYPVLLTPKKVAGGAFKEQQMEKVIVRKEEGIAKAQDNKEHAIRTASSMNKAIDLAIAEFANPKSLFTLEELIEKWRRYIWTNWDKTEQYPPF